jgi:hypothetical protein
MFLKRKEPMATYSAQQPGGPARGSRARSGLAQQAVHGGEEAHTRAR